MPLYHELYRGLPKKSGSVPCHRKDQTDDGQGFAVIALGNNQHRKTLAMTRWHRGGKLLCPKQAIPPSMHCWPPDCRACEAHLPLGPRPVLRAGEEARIHIVGQAPGVRVHATGISWDEPRVERLRA